MTFALRLSPALLRAALIAACLAGPARAETPPAPETPQTGAAKPAEVKLFEDGVAALKAGEVPRAVAMLYEALDRLRAARRIADAGVVAHWLGQALEASGNPQTDEAYAFSVAALRGQRNSRELVESARALMRRDGAGRGEWAATTLVDGIVSGMDEGTREDALAAVVKHYAAPEREEARAAAMARLAQVEGGGELLTFLRASTRALDALDLYKQGRLAEARALVEANLPDLRAAARKDALALATLLKARIDYADGAYTQALPSAIEAESLMRGKADDRAQWTEALSLRARLLERLDRPLEAVAALEEAETNVARDPDAQLLVAMLRLDRAQPLLRAERVAEARALLESEKARLAGVDFGGERQGLYVALFNDRAAALLLAERDYARAAEAAAAALRMFDQLPKIADGLRMDASRRHAEALAAGVDVAATEAALRKAIGVSERLFSPSHPEVAYDLSAYALHLKEHGRAEEAEAALTRVADILARANGVGSLRHAYALANLAGAKAMRENFAEAERLLTRAEEDVATAQGPPIKRAEMLALISNMQRLRGDPRSALRTIGRAADLARTLPQEKLTFGLKLTIDGSAVAALIDVGDNEQASRLAKEMTDAPTPAAREDRANFNTLLLVGALAAERSGRFDEALALTRRAGAGSRGVGQIYRAFEQELASISARNAWLLAASGATGGPAP